LGKELGFFLLARALFKATTPFHGADGADILQFQGIGQQRRNSVVATMMGEDLEGCALSQPLPAAN